MLEAFINRGEKYRRKNAVEFELQLFKSVAIKQED